MSRLTLSSDWWLSLSYLSHLPVLSNMSLRWQMGQVDGWFSLSRLSRHVLGRPQQCLWCLYVLEWPAKNHVIICHVLKGQKKWTFSIVPSACSRRDRQTGHFQGPVCVSRRDRRDSLSRLSDTDGTDRLAIFTVPSCSTETRWELGQSLMLLFIPVQFYGHNTTFYLCGRLWGRAVCF